jgi:hypothetical protein
LKWTKYMRYAVSKYFQSEHSTNLWMEALWYNSHSILKCMLSGILETHFLHLSTNSQISNRSMILRVKLRTSWVYHTYLFLHIYKLHFNFFTDISTLELKNCSTNVDVLDIITDVQPLRQASKRNTSLIRDSYQRYQISCLIYA